MNTNEILDAIDQEISRLQQARALLADGPAFQEPKSAGVKSVTGKRRGRPKGSISKKAEAAPPVLATKTRAPLSAEGKARIAAAQKARWAAQRKTEAKPAVKKAVPKPTQKAAGTVKTHFKKIATKVIKKGAVPARKSVAEPTLGA